jgi:molecular chaperone GrpE
MDDRSRRQPEAKPPTKPAPPELGQLEAEVEQLRDTLQTQSARLDEVTRAYSRLQQDKDDFRRRAEREKERVLEIERGNVGLALLDAVDQLDLTLQTIPSQTACRDCQGVGNGVRMIRDGLLRHIEQAGVARLPAVGTPFDPQRHEAVELVAVDDPALDGQVVTEIRAGYQQGERVLRPARVSVGKLSSRGKVPVVPLARKN